MGNILIPESFPNLPTALQKLQKLFAYGNIDNKQLALLLQDDPLLCANILKIVNSPHYGLAKKVSSINHAVMLLGATIIRGIVMAAILKKSFALNLSPYKISIEQFDVICALRVKFLNTWVHDETLDIQNLSSAAFLMEAGKIVTSNFILQRKEHEKFLKLLEDSSIEEAERTLFNMDSYQVAAMLFKKWEFEDNFTDLIKAISAPQTKEQKLLHVISILIGIKGILTDETIEEALSFASMYDYDITKLQSAIITVTKELV
ncbi:MAG: HDOD domain-containing protein [Thiovulaceae bacterium]|nr:HDOD domain-containing protein [Sulfurimonadaceae bacterium]